MGRRGVSSRTGRRPRDSGRSFNRSRRIWEREERVRVVGYLAALIGLAPCCILQAALQRRRAVLFTKARGEDRSNLVAVTFAVEDCLPGPNFQSIFRSEKNTSCDVAPSAVASLASPRAAPLFRRASRLALTHFLVSLDSREYIPPVRLLKVRDSRPLQLAAIFSAVEVRGWLERHASSWEAPNQEQGG